MHVDTTPEQDAYRLRVRRMLEALMTPALRAEVSDREAGGPLYMEAMAWLGANGWLGTGWPTEYGGGGRSFVEEFLFFDEMHRAGFPIPLLTLNTVGPTLIKFGTEAQKQAILPEILAGRLHFSIGYSEPSAGTDLASLATTALPDGDDFVINGQKIWISLADHADYLWLAARTDPEAPKHRGISILMVPMDAAGVSTTPIANLGDNNIHAVYLEDVRVPQSALVGPLHRGWRLITSQLNHERVALMIVGALARIAEEVRQLAAETPYGDGGTVLDRPWVRRNLAEVDAFLEALKLWNWRQAWKLDHEELSMQEASGIKVFGSEAYVRAHRLLLEILGVPGLVRRGSPGARLQGDLERHYRATLVLTFGGGVNEVQRDIVSMAGLGLPRMER